MAQLLHQHPHQHSTPRAPGTHIRLQRQMLLPLLQGTCIRFFLDRMGRNLLPWRLAFIWKSGFSDHLRRPHSGIGRLVLLPQDSIDWMTAIIAAWDDLLDPTLPWSCHIVETHVGAGDPDAVAQLILVQNPQPDHVSVLTTVYGGEVCADDAVLMCYTLPCSQPHQHLMLLLAQGLYRGQQSNGLRTWWRDLDITDIPQLELQHGAALTVCAQTSSSVQFDGGNTNAAHDDATSMLQHHHTIRTQIQLERLVPVPAPSVWVEIDCQRLDFLRNQLRSFPPIQPMFDRAFCDWHSSTSEALGDISDWSDDIPVGFTFYTDGSSHRGSGQAAAAVVLVVTTADGPRWGGFATTSCLGSPSAPRAEATALMLAIRWCIQLSAKYKGMKPWYEFAFDCQHVAGIAQGRQGGDHNCDLHLPMRALLHWIESDLSTAFTWTHLRSHQGHPWNEAADALCKHTLDHAATLFDLAEFHQQCTFDGNDLHMIQWLWLFERSLQGCPDAPPLVHLRWRLDIAQPLTSEPHAAIHPAMKRRDLQPDGPREMVHLDLQVGTANVLTLYPEQDYASQYMGARAESLARQFHDCNLQIIGLQETRSRLDGHTMLDNFHVLSAPAQKRGHGGVQLWVKRTLHDEKLRLDIEQSHLFILHASSRRLVVRLACGGLRLILIVLHAPTDDDEATLSKFWTATSAAIPQAYLSWKCIVLADANSRLGSSNTEAVGDYQATTENEKGLHFHRWLLERSLFLPQTFAEHHHGEGMTWTHSTGTKARLDYVACSEALRSTQLSTWIDERIDLSLRREDHACVRALVPIDFHHVALPRKRPHFTVTEVAPHPTWATDVHTHAAVLQSLWQQPMQPNKVMRKKHLSADTIKLIAAKRFHRHQLGKIRRYRRQAVLRQIFDSWRSQHPCDVHFQPWLRHCDRLEAVHGAHFADLSPRVVIAARQDDIDFYESLADQAGSESFRGSRRLWAAIRHVLPRWRSKQNSNLRCVGPTTEDKIHHYNLLEAGETTTYPDLLHDCWRNQQHNMHDAPLEVPLHDLPTRAAIENHCARLKIQKAPGLDQISPEALRQHGVDHAPALTLLLMKIWLTGAEPVQFKGGLIHTISKKQKSNRIADMRGIALLDGIAKLSHAMLRQQYIPHLSLRSAPLQLGGFAHQSTLFATQYLRACAHHASNKHLSSCVLFLDIKSAFHSMIREIVFDMGTALPQRLQTVLEQAGCSVPEIQQRCDGKPKLHGVPLTTARLLSEAHRYTWFTIASSDEIHHTHRGSRPGSPLADAAYNGLMVEVIQEIHTFLQKLPHIQDAWRVMGLGMPVVAWIDDLAIPVVTTTANTLVETVQEILEEVVRIGKTFGLILNMHAKKTEAVIAFRGDGAQAQRQLWFGERQGAIHVLNTEQVLRCVPRYEHLGTMFSADGTIAAELHHRLTKAIAAHHQVRRPILANKHIDSGTRLKLLEGLVAPVLFYGAGSWPLLSHRQITKIHGQYMKWIRSIIANGCWTSGMLSDQQVLLLWRLPSVSLRLAKMRLLHAFHFINDCPQAIVDVVTATEKHQASWIPALRHALCWLQTMDPALFGWDPRNAPLPDLFEWLSTHRADSPRLVRRLYSRALQQGFVVGRVVQAHWKLKACLQQSPSSSLPSSQIDVLISTFVCRRCASKFGTLHQLQVHLWLAHEEISEERSMMTSTTCNACNVCFWSSQRLQQHLRHSRRHVNGCYEKLTWRSAPSLTAPDIDEMPRQERFHRQPAMRVASVQSSCEVQLCSREAADQVWQTRWKEEGLPENIEMDWTRQLFKQFDVNDQRCLPNQRCEPKLSTMSSFGSLVWRLTLLMRLHQRRLANGHYVYGSSIM